VIQRKSRELMRLMSERAEAGEALELQGLFYRYRLEMIT
jgi:hypothetical protein